MSAAAVQQASATFDMIDRNHDGVITRDEFGQAAMLPTMTYAGPAPGAVVQQAVMMQPQPVVYSAPQQPIVYGQAAAPVVFSGQPQVTYSAAQPAVTYAAAPATQVTYQQAPAVTYAAPAASQIVYQQSAPALTYAAASTSQVTYEQTSPTLTYEAAPAAQVTYEQTAPAVTYAAAPEAVPVPTLISYPANTEQSVPAAGSASMTVGQPYMMVQPQAAYYQMGGVQAAAMQPQVAYGTTAPGMQTMTFEQQTVAQPCMAMTMPQMQQVVGSEQMTVPAGATMEQSFTVPQQTSGFAAPVMEQPAVVTSKKAKKKLTSNKKKGKTCC